MYNFKLSGPQAKIQRENNRTDLMKSHRINLKKKQQNRLCEDTDKNSININ